MRLPHFAVVVLLFHACLASAQTQEKKLMDRLLGKPDEKMVNSAQDKKFVAGGTGSLNKSATIATFHFHENSVAKTFQGDRSFAAKGFSSSRFGPGDTAANLSSRTDILNARKRYQTTAANAIRDAQESGKSAPVREFVDLRPFVEEGKSQKALNQQDRPMTIEEVRELLNKNK